MFVFQMIHSSNFYNLACFICHLFIDGQFRDGHILYHSRMFDDSLITEIDSICSDPIPWKFTDTSNPSVLSPPENLRTDYTMQLIFFDPEYSSEQIDQFKEYFSFYRIFIFPLVSQDDIQMHIFVLEKLKSINRSKTLILHYDSKTGSMHVHRIFDSMNIIFPTNAKDLESDTTSQFITKPRERVEHSNSFDQTFGEVEKSHPIEIKAACTFYTDNGHKKCFPLKANLFSVNYFSSTLNAMRINMKLKEINSDESESNEIVTIKRRKFYNDFAVEYESTNDKV